MTVLVSCRGLGHSAGTETLFRDLSFVVNDGDRIGLNGHNGCGKSTLLKLLSGEVEPDEGEIERRSGLRLGVVEQFLPAEVAEWDLVTVVAMELPAQDRDVLSFRAAVLLGSLGFREDQFELPVSALSGGQLNRLMLARALVNEPELVLFDEPSNHMDLATLAMLEAFLADGIGCAFVLVSHDRSLLDAVTSRTLILRDQRLYGFDMPYSRAREELTEMDIAAASARADEEKKIAALKASAKRLAVWGKVYDNEKFARKAKSMEKRVARLEQAKTFVSRGSGLTLSLDSAETKARRALKVEDLAVSPPGADGVTLFTIDDLIIRPGERIALLGWNGCGKTSLLTALMVAYQNDGDDRITFSPQATVGYYDQEMNEVLRGGPEVTMVDYLRRTTESPETALRNSLINAGFSYRDHDKPVNVLSGGERARLMFLSLRLNRPNFLIMDEPTNHIDIEGREELEAQLAESGATLLMTSHDRRFIDNVATRFLRIAGGRLDELDDPETFYSASSTESEELLSEARKRAEAPAEAAADRNRAAAQAEIGEQSDADVSEDDVLDRILELERLLEEDRARKPKFQKPKLQAAWRAELDTLNRQLSDLH
jgi:ATPase subunit of ABC transporter with duplicated ATPase domains